MPFGVERRRSTKTHSPTQLATHVNRNEVVRPPGRPAGGGGCQRNPIGFSWIEVLDVGSPKSEADLERRVTAGRGWPNSSEDKSAHGDSARNHKLPSPPQTSKSEPSPPFTLKGTNPTGTGKPGHGVGVGVVFGKKTTQDTCPP